MSAGRVLQYDRPAVLLTRPADPFVSRLTGVADRAHAAPVAHHGGRGGAARGLRADRRFAASVSLREVLSELVWSGADAAAVVERRHAARAPDAWRPFWRAGGRADAQRRPYCAGGAARCWWRFSLVPQRFAPLFAPLTEYGAPADLRPGQPRAARARATGHGVPGGGGEHPRGGGARDPGHAPERARSSCRCRARSSISARPFRRWRCSR